MNIDLTTLLEACKELRAAQETYFRASKAAKVGLPGSWTDREDMLKICKEKEEQLDALLVVMRDSDDHRVKDLVRVGRRMRDAQREYFANKDNPLSWKWLQPAKNREADFDKLIKRTEVLLVQPSLL